MKYEVFLTKDTEDDEFDRRRDLHEVLERRLLR